jgi:hypothetical protein
VKLVVWPDLSSKVVTEDELRVVLRAHPSLIVHDFDQPWSGKYLACEPEAVRGCEPLNSLPYRRGSDAVSLRAQHRAWGRVAREREQQEGAP